MKKVTAIIVSLIAFALMMSNAYAIETGDSAICSLSQLDTMAEAHGYEVSSDTADSVVRQYTCTLSGMQYTITLENEFLTKSAVEMDSDLPGAIVGTHVLVDGNHVIANEDFLSGLFIEYVTMEALEDALTSFEFVVDYDAPIPHYTVGNDNEGISISVIWDEIVVYSYGEDYGNLNRYDLTRTLNGTVLIPMDVLNSISA